MLAPVVLAADFADTIELTDRQDVRLRSTRQTAAPQEGNVQAPPASNFQSGMDLANQASGILRTHSRSWELSLTYSPLVTLADAELGINAQNEIQVFQNLTGLVGWHRRSTTLSLSEAVSYGQFNSAYLFQPGAGSATSSPGQVPALTGTATAPTTQLAPVPTVITFGSTTTSLTASEGIGRRTTVSAGASYTATGGLNETSRAVNPVASGPRADASVTYAISRSLRTATIAHGELTQLTASQCYTTDGQTVAGDVNCRPSNELVRVTQGLIDAVTRRTTLTLDAGVAGTRFRTDANLPFQSNIFPTGEASVAHLFGTHESQQTLVASVLASPLVDLRTGQILYGLQGLVTLIKALSPRVTVSVDAVGGQTFPTSNGLAASIVRSDVDVRYKVDRYGHVTLLAGESELWQNQPALGGFFSIYGYFAVTVATSALRF